MRGRYRRFLWAAISGLFIELGWWYLCREPKWTITTGGERHGLDNDTAHPLMSVAPPRAKGGNYEP